MSTFGSALIGRTSFSQRLNARGLLWWTGFRTKTWIVRCSRWKHFQSR